jgi:Uma2 family endonuclease
MFQNTNEQPPRHGEAMTPQEFEQLVERSQDIRYEYVRGRAYAMSGETANHSHLSHQFYRLLEDQLTGGPCHPFSGKHALLIANARAFPDIVVTCDVSGNSKDAALILSPHLVVEVLSTSSERIDRNEKFIAYTNTPSIEEYVLVHQHRPQVEVYRRADEWVPHIYKPGEEIELVCLDIRFSLDELYKVLL